MYREIKSYVKSLQEQYNKEHLTKIAKNGFKGDASSARVKSYDVKHEDGVCYFLVTGDQQPKPTSLIEHIFQMTESGHTGIKDPLINWQTKKVDGLWSLLLERDYSNEKLTNESSADIYEWDERLENSVLLLFNPQDINGCDISSMSKMAKSPIIDKKVDCIHPESFTHILAAQQDYKKIFTDKDSNLKSTKVQFSQTSTKLSQISFMAVAYSFNFRDECLLSPDYVSKIKDLIKTKSLSYPFGARIIRLATRRDVLRLKFLRDQLKLDKCLAFYKAKDPAVALRRIAHSGTREDVECLFYLLQKEQKNLISPDGTSLSTGKTALHYAAERLGLDEQNKQNAILIIKVLIQYGAKSNFIGEKKKIPTPRKICTQYNIDIDKIKSGEFEKNKFIKRTRTAMSSNRMFSMVTSIFGDQVGRHYHPSGLKLLFTHHSNKLTCKPSELVETTKNQDEDKKTSLFKFEPKF